MSLVNKEVEVTITGRVAKYYENKGYNIQKHTDKRGRIHANEGQIIKVKVSDLSKGSHVKVQIKCDGDNCTKIIETTWKDYLKNVKEDGKYYCVNCGNKIYGVKNRIKNKLKKGKSFYDWCYNNLDKEQADEIINRWDKTLNKCSSKDVTYMSRGFNNKGYWFKCLEHPEHNSELKNIQKFVKRKSNNLNCDKCNSFAMYLINNYGEDGLGKYWSDKNTVDPWEISYGTPNKKVLIKCQNVNYHEDYLITPNDFVRGKRCSYCAGRKVHPLDSLGQYIIDNYGQKFLDKIWSSKNKKSPFEYMPGCHQKVWFQCSEGKHEDYQRIIYNSIKYNFRCSECENYSKGEERISNYFIENKIDYEPQKEFYGLLGLGNGNLSYDFYLEGYNLLCEFQGKQHKEYIPGFHKSKKDFEKQVEHDNRKRNFAKEHNIKLLEIWYWDFDNIESILNKELKLNNITNTENIEDVS